MEHLVVHALVSHAPTLGEDFVILNPHVPPRADAGLGISKSEARFSDTIRDNVHWTGRAAAALRVRTEQKKEGMG
jgi:hypothetical protein